MDNYDEGFFNIIKVLNSTYGNLKFNYGVKQLVARYISEAGFNANDMKCELKDGYPKIILSDGSEILYQGNMLGLMQISIKKQTDKQKLWTVIDFPPNPGVKPYTDSSLPYSPRIDSFCIDERGMFYTSYSPYNTENGEIKYNPVAILDTSFYSNETLNKNGVSKDFINVNVKLSKIEPDDKYSTDIFYALVYDPNGDQTIRYNIVQAAIKIEEAYKDKSTNYKI